MTKLYILILCYFPFCISAQSTDTITVMVYNLLNFPNGRNDCSSNIVVPARWDTLVKIIDYVRPDILMVCELQSVVGADSILNKALNTHGRSGYQRVVFVPNRSSFPKDLNNLVFYNSSKLGLTSQSEILTDTRDASVYHLYCKDPNLALHQDTTLLDVLVTHLKAGSLATDAARRAEECDSIRKYIDTASMARNIVFGGDLNFYNSTEAGFQRLLSGIYPLNDPINMSGNWDNNAAFAPYHTQATRVTTPSYDCGALGGMDSRFDFLLTSTPVMTGTNRINYIPNTYAPLGNNGSTYNRTIKDPLNTSPVPDAVLNALFYMSDHLPIIMKLKITYPAVILPNQLTFFKGAAVGYQNHLTWFFDSSENGAIALEYSSDGIIFYPLASISVADQAYLHETESSLYYRLKWLNSGDAFYSSIIFIEHEHHNPIVNVFPNPSINGVFHVDIANDNTFQETEISLYSTLGNCVLQTSHNFSNLAQSSFEVQNVQNGVYHLRLKNKNYTIHKWLIFQSH